MPDPTLQQEVIQLCTYLACGWVAGSADHVAVIHRRAGVVVPASGDPLGTQPLLVMEVVNDYYRLQSKHFIVLTIDFHRLGTPGFVHWILGQVVQVQALARFVVLCSWE